MSSVSICPKTAAAANKNSLGTVDRYYWLLRYRDSLGSGNLKLETAIEYLADKLGLKHDTVTRTLKKGDGIAWLLKDDGRLWLLSEGRYAARVGAIPGRKRLVPVSEFTQNHREYRASVLKATQAAFNGMPKSQAYIEAVTGFAPNTQRAYQEISGTKVQKRFAIDYATSEENLIRGEIEESDGRYFKWSEKGKSYLAKLAPNSFVVKDCEPANVGRLQKNRLAAREYLASPDSDVYQSTGTNVIKKPVQLYHLKAQKALDTMQQDRVDTYLLEGMKLRVDFFSKTKLAGLSTASWYRHEILSERLKV